jgi:hypothetical protein
MTGQGILDLCDGFCSSHLEISQAEITKQVLQRLFPPLLFSTFLLLLFSFSPLPIAVAAIRVIAF